MTLAHYLAAARNADDLAFFLEVERIDPQLSPEQLAALKLAKLEAQKREGKR